MKDFVSYILRHLLRLYPYRLHVKLQEIYNFFYSLWICNALGEVGKKVHFARPLLLQGGGQMRIHIGSNTIIGHHTVLGCWESYGIGDDIECYEPEIAIGSHCNIGEYCHITAIRRISIGDGLLTGRFVFIGDNAHGELSMEEADIPPAQRHLTSKGVICIGRNVWIGDKVSIFGGVTIGDNVIIGAGSIVTHDIPSNCIAAGIPAKVMRQLNT